MGETLYRTENNPASLTRIIPLPSVRVPLSASIDQFAHQLEENCIDATAFHELSHVLNTLTRQIRTAQNQGDFATILPYLEQALQAMQEVRLNLKMVGVVERGRMSVEMLDHLTRLRQYNDETMAETEALLAQIESARSQ